MKKTSNNIRKKHIKAARNCIAAGDVKSLAKILSNLTPPMTIESFQQYLMDEANKKEIIK